MLLLMWSLTLLPLPPPHSQDGEYSVEVPRPICNIVDGNKTAGGARSPAYTTTVNKVSLLVPVCPIPSLYVMYLVPSLYVMYLVPSLYVMYLVPSLYVMYLVPSLYVMYLVPSLYVMYLVPSLYVMYLDHHCM